MNKRQTLEATCTSEAYRSRKRPIDMRFLNYLRNLAEREINLDDLEFRERGWDLLPHYHFPQPDRSEVIADWNSSPIKRVIPGRPGQICHPLQTISLDERIPIFPEGTSAQHDLERYEFALAAAKRFKVKAEIGYRWVLSEFGLLGCHYWARKWNWP